MNATSLPGHRLASRPRTNVMSVLEMPEPPKRKAKQG